MRFAIDHAVIAVHDLARAIEDYRALGFTVTIGGRHPGRTSHNALVVFEDGAYLELIAWTAACDERWYGTLQREGEGLVDFALVPEEVPRAIEEAGSRGLTLQGPFDGGRVRPDGVEIRWQTARQETFDLPFLCGDVTPRGLRVPEGEARKHPNGAKGIARIAVAVRDVEASRARYAALLGIRVEGNEVAVGSGLIRLEPVAHAREGPRSLELRGEGIARAELPRRHRRDGLGGDPA